MSSSTVGTLWRDVVISPPKYSFGKSILNLIRLSLNWNSIQLKFIFNCRYFKAKPEAQKLFPAFANVPVTELPTNHDFLNSAYTCITSLNYLIPYAKFDHPERCPAFPKHLKDKYNAVDLKVIQSNMTRNLPNFWLTFKFNRNWDPSGWRPCKRRWATLSPTTCVMLGRKPSWPSSNTPLNKWLIY